MPQIENNTEKDVVKSANDELRRLDPALLLEVLQHEEPRTAAEVICVLEPAKAALVLQNLPEDMRAAVAVEIVQGVRVLADVLELVVRDIVEKAQTLAEKRYVKLGGVDCMTELLNLVNRDTEKSLMEMLEVRSPELCEEVKNRMFVFEDIVLLDDRAIQKVLREIDTEEFAKALKGTDGEVKDKIFRNMSKRAAAILKEEMEFMGPLRVGDREEAQLRIVGTIRRLEDLGEIVIARSDADSMIM